MKGKNNFALVVRTIITKFYGFADNPKDIAHQYFVHHISSIQQWLLAAKNLGLKAKLSKHITEHLPFIALPIVDWSVNKRNYTG